ncbi:hypothetical protein B9Z55_014278 [Caenorhabditis nigoni]|uniref:CCHC-type domain-containing protein n=1 Tax=Caenorhabditis nigoni TaxID=1611254 RepID=A0A2G5U583_9PELO|nr:hypothetical protein B9Z55_014278 [Caenorhabditis nigoni]
MTLQQTTLTKGIRNNIKHKIHQSFVSPEERRLAPQLTANCLFIFQTGIFSAAQHSQAQLIMVSTIAEAFKFELMVQVEAAQKVYNNVRDVVAKPTPSIQTEVFVFCGAQLQKCRLSIGGIAKMIDEFLDNHQQLMATEEQRQACGQEILKHVEQDGLLAKLKCDIDSLLDMMEQSKASESDMSSGLRGDPGVVTSDAAATSGSRIGYAFRDFLCDGRSEIAPSLNNESLKLRSGLTHGAMAEEASRKAQQVMVSEDFLKGLMKRISQLTDEVLSSNRNNKGGKGDTLTLEELSAIKNLVKSFDGDATKYQLFISEFDYYVHDNDRIPKKLKQSILLGKLEGQAAKLLQSPELSDDNYDVLRENLHRQYGQVKYLRSFLITQLKRIKFDQQDLEEIEMSLNSFCNIANHLSCYNINVNDQFFLRNFASVLPDMMRKKVIKMYHAKQSTFKELSELAFDVLQEKKCSEWFDLEKSPEVVKEATKSNTPETEKEVNDNSEKFEPPCMVQPCLYCDKEDHSASQCTKAVDFKVNIVIKKKLCFNCLSQCHVVKNCKSRFRCYYCKAQHFSGHFVKKMRSPITINEFTKYCNMSDDEGLKIQLARHRMVKSLRH